MKKVLTYAKGLFNRGIVESGATEGMGVCFAEKEVSVDFGRTIVEKLGVTQIEDIQKVSTANCRPRRRRRRTRSRKSTRSPCPSAPAMPLSGSRMIDTAASYRNEEAVGRAIRKSGVCREELFITSKLWVSDASYDGAKRAFETSLSKLGLEYLDLYLLHQPMGDYYGAYRAMEELYEQGLVRAIGVCNFYPHVLADFCETVEVIPTVNQVELHPFFQQPEALALMADYEVQPEAWGPFAEGGHGIFTHPLLTEIGAKYGKSAAQVALRWNVQRGVAVIPKSVHRERMAQNRNIWDFELDEQEMASIAELDTGRSEIVNHFDPAFVRALHGRVTK